MHDAVVAVGRRLGFASGEPNLVGLVYAIESDFACASDAPPWSRAVWWLAIAPTAAVLVALSVAVGAVARLVGGPTRPSRPQRRLTYGLAGYVLGRTLARRHQALARIWRLDTPIGARAVRMAISPSHHGDVRVGDTLRCWVRGGDRGLSADRVDNVTTGERITPRRPAALLLLWAAVWAAILLMALVQVLAARW